MKTWFTEESVGVDVGFANFVTLSSGEKLNEAPKKVACKLAATYGVICVETLSPSIRGFKYFFGQLEAACVKTKARLVRIGQYFPSTKKCSCCGIVRDTIPLKVRQWTCEKCGTEHDRDINAAKNIEAEGLRLLQVERRKC